jgi:hypothetical protein
VKYIFILLSLSLFVEFFFNATYGKSMSNFLIFLFFIFFLFPIYIAWLVSILINYKIAYLNYKFFINIENQFIKKRFIIYKFKKVIFDNSGLSKCLNKEDAFNEWYLFIISFYFMIKELIYSIIIPIRKLKLCSMRDIVYVDEELQPYLKNIL